MPQKTPEPKSERAPYPLEWWVEYELEKQWLPAILDDQIGALPAETMEWDGATWNAWEQARDNIAPTAEEWEMIKKQYSTSPWLSSPWIYFIGDGGGYTVNFLIEASEWTTKLMDEQMGALPSLSLLQWEYYRDRYMTHQQWLASNPSPGQSYQPFSLPRPKQ